MDGRVDTGVKRRFGETLELKVRRSLGELLTLGRGLDRSTRGVASMEPGRVSRLRRPRLSVVRCQQVDRQAHGSRSTVTRSCCRGQSSDDRRSAAMSRSLRSASTRSMHGRSRSPPTARSKSVARRSSTPPSNALVADRRRPRRVRSLPTVRPRDTRSGWARRVTQRHRCNLRSTTPLRSWLVASIGSCVAASLRRARARARSSQGDPRSPSTHDPRQVGRRPRRRRRRRS